MRRLSRLVGTRELRIFPLRYRVRLPESNYLYRTGETNLNEIRFKDAIVMMEGAFG